MKNTLTIIALSAVFAASLFAVEGLAGKVTMGLESDYVFRGKKLADASVQSSVEASYKLGTGSLYAGVWANDPSKTDYTEVDLYVGYKLPVFEKYTADVGMTYYWYTESTSIDRTREIYAGVTYNGLWVNPAVYAFYDFDLEQFTVEASGKYSWDLSKWGLANTSLDVGAKVGAVNTQDVDAGYSAGEAQNSYVYYAVNADVVYALSKTASASVGIRYAANNDDVTTGSAAAQRDDNFFWGFKFAAGF
jgi:uncharacterized protein (TIGR02001 family)